MADETVTENLDTGVDAATGNAPPDASAIDQAAELPTGDPGQEAAPEGSVASPDGDGASDDVPPDSDAAPADEGAAVLDDLNQESAAGEMPPGGDGFGAAGEEVDLGQAVSEAGMAMGLGDDVTDEPLIDLSGDVPVELQRILHIEVPVIVKLADKDMPIGEIVDLTPGGIVEFSRAADTPLELMVNNKVIGRGAAVKVGEKFGLRVNEILPVDETIRRLGE